MSVFQRVGKGLGLLFAGEILQILDVIPLLGGLLNLIGLILLLVGLGDLGKIHANYKKAFQYTLINFIVTFLAWLTGFELLAFLSDGIAMISVIFEVASFALAFFVLKYVCETTAAFINIPETATKAQTVVKIYGAIYIICAATAVLGLIPLFEFFTSGFFSVVLGILNIVGGILYLIYLNTSKKILNQMM